MNYATLVKTIKAYVENDFPSTVGTGTLSSTEQIDTFIKQAEQRIYNEAQLIHFRKNQTGTVTDSNMYLTLPTDWMSMFSLAVVDPTSGEHTFLESKDVSFIREAFPDPTAEGKPTHYALFDTDSVLLGPTPDVDYVAQMHYFFYPETIVTASTTWIGDNFDDVLLYGSLIEAYTFMKGEEDILVVYKARYDEAMIQLKMLAEGKHRQDMYRTEQIRYPVQ